MTFESLKSKLKVWNLETLHKYVSSDPSTAVTGTVFPKPTSMNCITEMSLSGFQKTAISVSEGLKEDITSQSLTRRIFLNLAFQSHWPCSKVAEYLNVPLRTVQYWKKHEHKMEMHPAVLLCLGDSRFL